MQPANDLKGLLFGVLGLQSSTEPGSKDDCEHTAAADDAGAAAAPVLPQSIDQATPDLYKQATAGKEQQDTFSTRLASINQRYASDASAARDAQQLLQDAQQQAALKEAEVLAAADAAYTPAWRQTGLPSKVSQLHIDEGALSGRRLLDSAAILAKQHAHQQEEVLSPPAVLPYRNQAADPHYLQVTGNQRVRQGIAAARCTASKAQSLQQGELPPACVSKAPQQQSRLQSQQTAGAVQHCSPTKEAGLHTAAHHAQLDLQPAGRAGRAIALSSSGLPWSQLPPEEAAAKVAAASARYKAMAAIMTPQQREVEDRIIKRMYQRLSFLRNPRYAVLQGNPAPADPGLRGSNAAHRHQTRHTAVKKDSRRLPVQQAPTLTATAAGFSVIPTQGVLFDKYEPGGVYFQTLQLQNVGTVMQQLRLLPPQSRYFQASFPRFPLASSTLAPGMCAEVDICFMPDSLGDYEDSLAVDTPAGKFEVPLTGRRPHPNLTLPPVLEVGDVLVGNKRTRTFEFVNSGGDGRFLLLTAQQWTATLAESHQTQESSALLPPSSGATSVLLQSSVTLAAAQDEAAQAGCRSEGASEEAVTLGHRDEHATGRHSSVGRTVVSGLHDSACDNAWTADTAAAAVSSGPICISPAYLDLPAGAVGQLSVEFSPLDEGVQGEQFWLVCDNCTAHPLSFEGCGSTVQVELVGLDDRQWLPQDAAIPLWLGEACTGSHHSRRLRVYNATQLPFPYQWSVQSQLVPALCPYSASAFTVNPAAGVLQAKAEVEFTLEFRPQGVGVHRAALTLAVQRSGDAGLLSITQWDRDDTAVIDLGGTVTSTTQIHPSMGGTAVSSTSACQGVPSLLTDGLAAAQPAAAAAAAAPVSHGTWPGASMWHTVAHVAVEGVGCPISLSLEPAAALRLPGALTVGDEACMSLLLRNDTPAPAHYTVCAAPAAAAESSAGQTATVAAAAVSITPSEGCVPALSTQQLLVEVKAQHAGVHTQDHIIHVMHGHSQQLQVQLEVKQVRVIPSHQTVDLGVLCVGASATHMLQLTNTAAHSRASWHLQQEQDSQASLPSAALKLKPGQGSLAPLASCSVGVTVTGNCEGRQRLLLCISSNSGSCSLCRGGSSSLFGAQGHSDKEGSHPGRPGFDVPAEHPLHEACIKPGQGAAGAAGSCSCTHEYVQLFITVAAPTVVLSKYRLPLRHAYIGVSQQHNVYMTNTSSFPLSFTWAVKQLTPQVCKQLQRQQQQLLLGEPPASVDPAQMTASCLLQDILLQGSSDGQLGAELSGGHGRSAGSRPSVDGNQHQPQASMEQQAAGMVQLSINPATGQLGPGQSVELQLAIEPVVVGPVALLCCCQVPAMSRLVGFVLTGTVGGLQVKYSILQPEELQGGSHQVTQQHPGNSSSCAESLQVGLPRRPALAALQAADQQPVVLCASAASHASAHHSAALAAASAETLHVERPPYLPFADFGVVSLHQPAELLLQVTNLTSISSQLRAWMGRFAASNQQSGASSTMMGRPPAGACQQAVSRCAGPAVDVSPARAAAGCVCSPMHSATSQHPGSTSRANSPGSQAHPAHRRALSPQHKGRRCPTAGLTAAALAAKLSRTDPGTHTGCQAEGAVAVPPEVLVTAYNSITQGTSTCGSCSTEDSTDGRPRGPFRAFAGNAMMVARQAAAAAAAALGSGTAGCSVRLQPSACELPSWGSCMVRLQAFNNLPGTYADTLFVQVGDLPPQRIPFLLQVTGSPLVLSKHRALRPASDVLMALLHQPRQKQQPAAQILPAAHTNAQMVAEKPALADAHVRTDSSFAAKAQGSSATDCSLSQQDSRTACGLDFGVVPAGVEVQHMLYVTNTGPLPMLLTWQVEAGTASQLAHADNCEPHSGNGSSGTDDNGMCLPSAGTRMPDVELLSVAGDDASSLAGSRPATAATVSCPESAVGVHPHGIGAVKDGLQPFKPPAGIGKKGTVSAPGGSAAAAAVGDKQAATRTRAVVSAGRAPTNVRRHSITKDVGTVPQPPPQQQQNSSDLGPLQAAEGDGLHSPSASVNSTDGSRMDGPVADDGNQAQPSKAFDAELPPGGPSGLLQILQSRQGGSGAASSSGLSITSAPGTDLCNCTAAEQAFRVVPEACVIAAGQQQQFVVTFCSPERLSARVIMHGRQSFCCPDSKQQSCSGSMSDAPPLRLHLLPSHGRSNKMQSRCMEAPGVDSDKPLHCCITGGFLPDAAPPPKEVPPLTVSLFARAAEPQLLAVDPDSFVWHCMYTAEPSSHPSYQQTATLYNSTGCPQVFKLQVDEGPFQLVAVVPSVPQDVDLFRGLVGADSLPAVSSSSSRQANQKQRLQHGQTQSSSLLMLPPGESVELTIRFVPPVELSVLAGAAGRPEAAKCSHDASLGASDGLATHQHHGQLTVVYANGQQQILPLQGYVVRPWLHVPSAASTLDFGSVHALAPKTLELRIANPTQADAAWHAAVQIWPKMSTTCAGVSAGFSVEPSSGILPRRGLGMPRQSVLKLTFAPQRSGLATAGLLLSVCGGDDVQVVLQGVAVHSEGAELRALYDL